MARPDTKSRDKSTWRKIVKLPSAEREKNHDNLDEMIMLRPWTGLRSVLIPDPCRILSDLLIQYGSQLICFMSHSIEVAGTVLM